MEHFNLPPDIEKGKDWADKEILQNLLKQYGEKIDTHLWKYEGDRISYSLWLAVKGESKPRRVRFCRDDLAESAHEHNTAERDKVRRILQKVFESL